MLFVAAATSGALQLGLWGLALVLDTGGPFLFGADGWKLVPGHFAERHGLIVLIALGESIVALGVGARTTIDADVVIAAVLGVIVAATLWWVYFDVTALVAERRLSNAKEGRERNELARDSYSYLHFPMVAGIALLAVGLKVTIEHDGDPLKLVPTARCSAVPLLICSRTSLSACATSSRSAAGGCVCSLVLLVLVPVTLALKISSLATLAILAAVLSLLIVYEVTRYADVRERVRHQVADQPAPERDRTALSRRWPRRKLVGLLEEILLGDQPRQHPIAQVRWVDVFRRFAHVRQQADRRFFQCAWRVEHRQRIRKAGAHRFGDFVHDFVELGRQRIAARQFFAERVVQAKHDDRRVRVRASQVGQDQAQVRALCARTELGLL